MDGVFRFNASVASARTRQSNQAPYVDDKTLKVLLTSSGQPTTCILPALDRSIVPSCLSPSLSLAGVLDSTLRRKHSSSRSFLEDLQTYDFYILCMPTYALAHRREFLLSSRAKAFSYIYFLGTRHLEKQKAPTTANGGILATFLLRYSLSLSLRRSIPLFSLPLFWTKDHVGSGRAWTKNSDARFGDSFGPCLVYYSLQSVCRRGPCFDVPHSLCLSERHTSALE